MVRIHNWRDKMCKSYKQAIRRKDTAQHCLCKFKASTQNNTAHFKRTHALTQRAAWRGHFRGVGTRGAGHQDKRHLMRSCGGRTGPPRLPALTSKSGNWQRWDGRLEPEGFNQSQLCHWEIGHGESSPSGAVAGTPLTAPGGPAPSQRITSTGRQHSMFLCVTF